MENYNETAGNNRNDRNNGSIRDNNQESLRQRNINSHQEQQEQGPDAKLVQDRKRVDVSDMPEIKPEVNQSGI